MAITTNPETTKQTAQKLRKQFISDIVALKPRRDEQLQALEQQAQALMAFVGQQRQKQQEAIKSYLEENSAALEAHVEAELGTDEE